MILLPDANISSIPSGASSYQGIQPQQPEQASLGEQSPASIHQESSDAQSPDLSKVTIFAKLDSDSSASVDRAEAKATVDKGFNISGHTIITSNVQAKMKELTGMSSATDYAKDLFNKVADAINVYSSAGGVEVDASEQSAAEAKLDEQVQADIKEKINSINSEAQQKYDEMYSQAFKEATAEGILNNDYASDKSKFNLDMPNVGLDRSSHVSDDVSRGLPKPTGPKSYEAGQRYGTTLQITKNGLYAGADDFNAVVGVRNGNNKAYLKSDLSKTELGFQNSRFTLNAFYDSSPSDVSYGQFNLNMSGAKFGVGLKFTIG